MPVLPITEDKLALYIHWPFCKAKCPYCDFNSHVRASVDQDAWQKALLSELDYWARRFPNKTLVSIFFGGGTPSLMPPATVAKLIERATQHWTCEDGLEITLEANPSSVEAAAFQDLAHAGVNRVSLGIQALHDDALRFLGRLHNVEEAIKAIDIANHAFKRTSIDLIYARPGQKLKDWEEELKTALAFGTEHLSLYQLTIEPGTAFHTQYAQGSFTLPDEDEAADMFELTQNLTKAQGRPAYEISNHAAPGAESRHNLVYWQGGSYIGIGPGAHGRYRDQNGWHSSETLRLPEKWLTQMQTKGHGLKEINTISNIERAREMVMMGLRLNEGVHFNQIQTATGHELGDYIDIDGLNSLIDQGVLTQINTQLRTSEAGKLLLNALLPRLLK